MTALPQLWNQIRSHLTLARQELVTNDGRGQPNGQSPDRPAGTLADFEEFLEHNELELAWDALAAVAKRNDAPSSVWRHLSEAAALMGLQPRKEEALRRSQIVGA
jgi:hypothetical protein